MSAGRAGRDLGVLAAVAVACSLWNWLRIDSLLQGDNLRWMSEAARAAQGELVYRDFASMYPPLGIALPAAAYRALGASFFVTELVVCALSFATVVVTWLLARRFTSDTVALGVALALGCAGATNSGNFALFSLQLYTPSILCGSIGLGLTLIGAVDLARSGAGRCASWLVAIGTNVALLAKLEHGFAALAVLAVLCVLRRKWFGAIALALAATLPALVVYLWLAHSAGAQNLLDGLGGYGIAGRYCPLWPTGLGLFGAVAALGQAAALFGGLALTRPRPGSAWRWLALIAAGGALWAAYLPHAVQNFAIAQPGLHGPMLVLGYVFSLNGVLAPVMWASLALLVASARSKAGATDHGALLLLVAGAVLASRGLFGHMFGNTSIVHQSSYPIWFVAAPYLIGRALRWLHPAPAQRLEHAVLLVAALLAVGPRMLLSAARRQPYPALSTASGSVYVGDAPSRAAHDYVMRHTSPEDRLLEAPLGGGMSFATRRRPATHTMQFYGLLTPERLMKLDLELLREHPARLVLGRAAPHLGAQYGICAAVACAAPKLVWRSEKLACLPDVTPLAITFVESRYTEVARFGDTVVLRR